MSSSDESGGFDRDFSGYERRVELGISQLARTLRRRWRCLRRRWVDPGVRYVYSRGYASSFSGVPLDPLRGELIVAFLTEEGLLHPDDLLTPRPASVRNLLRVHTPDYLDSIQHNETLLRILGVAVDDEGAQAVVHLQRLMVGGTLRASRLARRTKQIVVNLGGGLHHAHRDSGMAFCVFNDVAVAVARLRANGFRDPVLVVDLDMHDGNGTRSVFAHDPTVHTYSIHNEHWGETEVEASTSIALGNDVGDELLLGTLLKTLPPVVEEVEPGFVFYIAAADAAADDPLGSWKMTAEGILGRDRFVIELFRRRRKPVPMVVLLGGGYGDKAWRYSARFMSVLHASRASDPPHTVDMMLTRFRRISGRLDPSSLRSDPDGFSWRLTDEDLVGIVPGAPRQTHFLNYFSSHGLELALERFGILDLLRLLGFRHPTVDIDLEQSLGDTLRIWTGPDRAELVVELRVSRNRRDYPGFELLVVEWLLLQNPRAEFGPYRRPLPSQKHPGLGMLKDMFGFLVMVCEILELDGVYYVPSSYHVVTQSRRLVRFLEPSDEARYLALQQLLRGRPLPEASRLVAEGEVREKNDAAFVWEGWPMVMPVSQALKERVSGEDYERRVAEELGKLSFSLGEAAVDGEVS